jgi:hypothetical protein
MVCNERRGRDGAPNPCSAPDSTVSLPSLRNNFLSSKFVLQTEKIELETTVVDETKERESYCGQGNRRFSG